jgi:hypothetical protein
VRAQSASLLLLYYEPGTHEEITRWHEEIHRPEMHASIAHIYHSEDWVAPPEYMAVRPSTELERNGGEYLSLYWSDGSVEDLLKGVREFAEMSARQGKYHPHQEVVWRERLRVTGGRVRPGLDVTVDTVPLLHNNGLLATISRVADGVAGQDQVRWSDSVHAPRMLGTGLFSGHYTLQPMHDENVFVDLYFIERGDPLAQYQRLLQLEAGWYAEVPEELQKPLFTGLYRPIVPGAYDRFYR